jgi:hypothetical protein
MNSAFIIPVTSWSPFPLSRKKQSISSMKIMHGLTRFANENNAWTNLFDSPYHLFVRVDTLMLMKVAPLSFARTAISIQMNGLGVQRT